MTIQKHRSCQRTTQVHDVQNAGREIVRHKGHNGKGIVRLPILLVFSLAIPVGASAQQSQFFGTICQPVNGSRNFVEYNQYGVSNISSTTFAKVECALPTHCENSRCLLINVQVVLYDRSTSANVTCRLLETDDYGNAVWQRTASSTNGGPRSAPSILNFLLTRPAADFWSLQCTLPPMQSGWNSYVTTVRLLYTEF